MSSETFIRLCREWIAPLASNCDRSRFFINGVWRIEYALLNPLRVSAGERPVQREFILVDANGYGSAHYDIENRTSFPGNLIGKSALELRRLPVHVEIAVLDAIASRFVPPCDEKRLLAGDIETKVIGRTEAIVQEALKLAALSHAPRPRVVLVGALGSILARLLRHPELEVLAVDGHPDVVGRSYHGVVIASQQRTIELVESADVSIVTGMVLATNTIDEILDANKRGRGRLLLFMQTGANLVVPAFSAGVSSIVSEPYPFYFMGSSISEVKIYRAKPPA